VADIETGRTQRGFSQRSKHREEDQKVKEIGPTQTTKKRKKRCKRNKNAQKMSAKRFHQEQITPQKGGGGGVDQRKKGGQADTQNRDDSIWQDFRRAGRQKKTMGGRGTKEKDRQKKREVRVGFAGAKKSIPPRRKGGRGNVITGPRQGTGLKANKVEKTTGRKARRDMTGLSTEWTPGKSEAYTEE